MVVARSPADAVLTHAADERVIAGTPIQCVGAITTQKRIRDGKLVEKLLNEKKSPADIIANLYLTVMSRLPTEIEREKLLAVVDEQKEPAKVRHSTRAEAGARVPVADASPIPSTTSGSRPH